MAFWTANMEPLRQYRWYIVFGGSSGNLDNMKYALKKADKPKAKVNSVQHKYLNHFFNYPGRLEWEDINITFAAVTDPNSSVVLRTILTNAGYIYPTVPEQNKTIGKENFVKQIGNKLSLIQINPEGAKLEEWNIINPFFTSVQFGSLDYSSEEIVEIQCTVKYDSAALA